MASVIQDDRAYRRGLVLGLTMAEIAILLIFCLLLALAALLIAKDKEIEAARAESEALRADKAELQEKLDLALSAIPSADEFEDRFQELTLAREKIEKLEGEMAALIEKALAHEQVEQALKEAGLPADAEKLNAAVEEAIAARNAIREAGFASPHEAREALRDAASRQGVNERMRAENERLRARLAELDEGRDGVGKGTEMPSCWFDPATEKTEYIFDVALSSSGLIVRDRDVPPNHAAEKARLPIEITFDTELSPEAFLSQARPLFEWSVRNECRFFVRAFDRTAPHEKELFKQRLLTLEQRFYKLLVQDGRW